MRLLLNTTLLFLVIVLSGCGQEKAQVETYLAELTSSNNTMSTIGVELQKSNDELKREIGAGNFDVVKVKSVTQGYRDQMDAELKRFEKVTVPEKCKTLHDATLEFYGAQLEVLSKAIDMAEYSKKASDLSKQAAGNPKKLVALKPELETLEKEMAARQKSMFESLKKGQEADTRVKAERKKLEDEFRIAPVSTAQATAAPAASPAPTGTP